MHLYLDTANAAEWTLPPGCAPFAGVTTNPSLILQAGLPVTVASYQALIAAAVAAQLPALMLQLPSANPTHALAWASELTPSAQGLELTFKLPCHPDWQACHSTLKRKGLLTLLTGVSNPMQLLWAKAQGADWVAPYLSRLEAGGRNTQNFIEACCAVQYDGGPKLMAASIKKPEMLTALIAAGAAAATIKPEFAASMAQDAMTNAAMAQFELDIASSLV